MKPRATQSDFYLVLYTETDADLQRIYCGGGLDLGLTPAGIESARRLAGRFKKNPLKIKKMMVSPELRAVQMADVLHDEIKAKMILRGEFSDQFLGQWEGQPLPYLNGSKDLPLEPPRGESRSSFEARIQSGFEILLAECKSTPGGVLLVTHPRVARVILERIGLGNEKIERGALIAVNCSEQEGVSRIREIN